MKEEWIKIAESSDGTYTELLDLGFIGLVRTYSWCCVNDEPKNICMVTIDGQSSRALADQHRRKEDN